MKRNIVVFEILVEGQEPVLDWRLKGQALPAHSCPVAMVFKGKKIQWEAQEFQWEVVRAMAEAQSGYAFDE